MFLKSLCLVILFFSLMSCQTAELSRSVSQVSSDKDCDALEVQSIKLNSFNLSGLNMNSKPVQANVNALLNSQAVVKNVIAQGEAVHFKSVEKGQVSNLFLLLKVSSEVENVKLTHLQVTVSSQPFNFSGGTMPGQGGMCNPSSFNNCLLSMSFSPTLEGLHESYIDLSYKINGNTCERELFLVGETKID